jgi:hypothetical protein
VRSILSGIGFAPSSVTSVDGGLFMRPIARRSDGAVRIGVAVRIPLLALWRFQ